MSEPADLRIWYHYLTGIDLKAGLKEQGKSLYYCCSFCLEPALFNHHHEQLLS